MKRKEFIKASLVASSGLLLASFARKNVLLGMNKPFFGNEPLMSEYGVQIWTVRDDMQKDPKQVLAKIASYGYKNIESFEGKDGIFWGMSAKDFKSYLDSLGLKMVSVHMDVSKDFEMKVEQLASIGVEYAICPYVGTQENLDKFKAFADEFNKKGEICKKHGIKFAYHNHDYSFKKLEGQYPQDIFMTRVDADLMEYEMDLYWVVVAGEDPMQWLEKYPNRFRLCHVKDLRKTPGTDNGKNSCNLGTGQIDFPKILAKAKSLGMKHFIVEQEAFEGTSPLDAIAANAKYMNQFKS